MAWSYSGDPSASALDEVRYLIQDTDTTDQQLQNEEINYHLAKNNSNVLEAAIDAVGVLVAKYAREVTREVGDLRVEAEKMHEHYASLQVTLKTKRNKSKPAASIFIGNNRDQRSFKVGMMDRSFKEAYDTPREDD